jgi:hypothetical protein
MMQQWDSPGYLRRRLPAWFARRGGNRTAERPPWHGRRIASEPGYVFSPGGSTSPQVCCQLGTGFRLRGQATAGCGAVVGAGVVRAPADRPLRPRVDVVAWRLGSPSTVNAGNRCADRPFPRSRPTVGAEGMHSIDALVCVLLFRPDACECSFLNLLSSLQLHPSYARENAVPALRGTPTA